MELYITTAPKGDGCSFYIVIKINWKRDKRLVFTALDSTQYNIIVAERENLRRKIRSTPQMLKGDQWQDKRTT